MYGIKAVLTLGLLLTAAEARPEGYGGVKGGRNHKSTANAFATSQATAHADGGYPGGAQSFAGATANAVVSGGTGNAAATANAYADGGNIGKVIGSDDANRNANPPDDSDNLRLSSDHSKDSENQSDNHADGTSVRGHHNANTGSYGNGGSVGANGQDQDRRPGCGVPAGVKGHRGTSGCTDRNIAEEEPSVSNPYPAYNGNPDLSAGSKYPTSLDGGYGGDDAGPQPCASGVADCPNNKPSVSNPHATYNGNPNLSGGSEYPTGPNGGYGDQPCPSGASGCPKNKPSVSNPHPTYNGNPDLSAGSKYPTTLDGDYGGNNAKPEPPKCSSGASGCSGNKPSVSNPHAAYPGYADLSPDSQHSVDIHHGEVGDHTGKPQGTPCFPGDPRCLAGSKPKPTTPNPSAIGIIHSGPIPCTSGSIDCPETKPDTSNSYPTHQGNPHSSPQDTPCFPGDPRCLTGSKPKSTTSNPSTTGVIHSGPIPCTSGSIDCPKTNPGVANSYPTHQKNPGLSDGSKYPSLNGDYGGKTPTAGGNQDNSGSSQYPGSSRNPDTSNPFLNGEIDVSAIKDSVNAGAGSDIKTNPSNPFLNPNSHVPPSTCTKHPEKPNGSYGGSPTAPTYPHGGSSGDSTLPTIKPNPSNPFLSHNGNVDSPNGVKYPGISSGIPQNTNSPSAQGHPATNGGCHGATSCASNEPGYRPSSSEYPINRPNPSNPFLSHNGNVDSTNGVKHPGINSGIPQNTNSPSAQGHPTTNSGCHGSSSCTSNEPGHPPSSAEYPVNKPNPSNPFLSHNGNVDSANGVKHPGDSSGIPQNTNSPSAHGHPATNGGCHGSTSCTSNEPGHPPSSSDYPIHKVDPSNPFLPHNGEVDKTTGTKYPNLKPPVLKNPGSFGESSYDRIDPHSNDKNFGSQDVPNNYPGKEPTGSNPFSDDGQFTNAHASSGSHETPNSPKPLPGHGIAESPATERKPEVINGYHGNGYPYGTENHGVKTHQPGVKGGSRRREPPAKLQGSSGLDESELLFGNTGAAYSTAHASASASAYSSAHASSSSSSGGGHSSAKSEAYSDLGNSGSSNSWASSSASASASASAFASSSSHQGSENWEFPDVTSQ